MTEKTKFYATCDFTDAGLEKAFIRGAELTDEPGVANYAAAGCASTERPTVDTDASQTPAKTSAAKG